MGKNKLIIVSILIIILGLGFYYFRKYENYGVYGMNDSSYRAEVDKLNQIASVDHCVDGVYMNDYIGISLNCPNGLMAQEFNSGITKSYKEAVNFIKKRNKINTRDNIERVFSIELHYEKFDPNNINEFYYAGEKFNQVDSYKLMNEAEAVTGPLGIKIYNIKKTTIGDNQYYVYSFTIGKDRTDIFIIPLISSYIKFKFNNQDEDYTKNVLSSVKKLKNGWEERQQDIKNQVVPIVESYLRNIGKFDHVKMSIYDEVPYYESYINLDKTTFNISNDENTVSVSAVIDFKGKIRRWDWNLEKYKDWEPIGSQSYSYKLTRKNGIFQIIEGAFFNLKN